MKKRKTPIKNKQILFFSLLVVAALVIYFTYYKKRVPEILATASSSTKIMYPEQYSDRHITEVAKVSDPRFRNIVFFDKDSLLANVISSISKNTGNLDPNGQENGTWLWTPILEITPEYQNAIILGAKKNNIKNIYISIDSYLDIYTEPQGLQRDAKKKKFDSILESFITLAHKNNITVDAEGGWRNWAEKGNSYKAFAVLDYAIEFNRTHKEKFRGFQYDIEPYILEYYPKNKTKVLSNFVKLIDEVVVKLDKTDLELGVVIPDFYDGTLNETPKFSYRGETAYAFDHLLKIMERRRGSKIIIMSYRNFSLGDDGSIDISKYEVKKANSSSTKIIVAQETGEVEPPYITFHSTPRSYYQKQVKALQLAFKDDKSFNGIATHYVNSFMELK